MQGATALLFDQFPRRNPMPFIATILPLASPTGGILPLWALVLAAVVVGAWIVLQIVGAEANRMRGELVAQHRAELQARIRHLRQQGKL